MVAKLQNSCLLFRVREKYYLSDIRGYSVFPHGNLLLSKYPFHNMLVHNYSEKAFAMKTMINAEFVINDR